MTQAQRNRRRGRKLRRAAEAAKKARLEGVVTLECRITPEGKVADVKVLHGTPELNDAATVGIVFVALDTRLTHAHGIWHLFVLAGSASHYYAILRYVL